MYVALFGGPLLFKKIIYFILVALGLHCCVQALSSCGERGLLSSCGAQASHCSGFSCHGQQALGAEVSVAARKLGSCGLLALECSGFSSCGCRCLSCGLVAL